MIRAVTIVLIVLLGCVVGVVLSTFVSGCAFDPHQLPWVGPNPAPPDTPPPDALPPDTPPPDALPPDTPPPPDVLPPLPPPDVLPPDIPPPDVLPLPPPVPPVVPSPTTVSVTASNNPSVFGEWITFTAKVTAAKPGSGIPTGWVQFNFGGAGGTSQSRKLVGGVATLSTKTLKAGSHPIAASYKPSGNFNPSTWAGSQQVKKAYTHVVIWAPTHTSVLGQWVTFTAKVTAVAPSSGTPGPSVTFYDGPNPIQKIGLNKNGQATLPMKLKKGLHFITAHYMGNVDFQANQSLPWTLLVK
jgi:hypothetical protein